MGYRTHWTHAASVAVQVGTEREVAEQFGSDAGDAGSGSMLVLNDTGNMEAFILGGPPEALRDLGQRIIAQADAIDVDGDVHRLAEKHPDAVFLYFEREELDERNTDDEGEPTPLTDQQWADAKSDFTSRVYRLVSDTDLLHQIVEDVIK